MSVMEPTREEMVVSANRALWVEVSSAVRAVFLKIEGKNIVLIFIVHGEISEDDLESVSCVETETSCDFYDGIFSRECIRIDAPHPVPQDPHWWTVYASKERLLGAKPYPRGAFIRKVPTTQCDRSNRTHSRGDIAIRKSGSVGRGVAGCQDGEGQS